MSTQPIAIVHSGMVSGVGLDAPSSCAAIRCALDNFQETSFKDKGGEWVMGSSVPLAQPWRGRTKLVKMASMAIRECLQYFAGVSVDIPTDIPMFLCIAERERPGRLDGLEENLFGEIESELGYQFHPEDSRGIPLGRVSVAVALKHARDMLYGKQHPFVLIAGVDSLLVGPTLNAFEDHDRLLTSKNSNGFIPGEAGAAILVCKPGQAKGSKLLCQGLGFAVEEAAIESETPLRADGLTNAIRGALEEAECSLSDMDFRISDITGEQYYFKEAELVMNRLLRKHKEHFYLLHPTDCMGEVGAATGIAQYIVALASSKKSYAVGNNIICQHGNDQGQRAATILNYIGEAVG